MRLFIFSRRAIQERLDKLAANLLSEDHASLVARLERRGDDRLPAMWEVVWLHALTSITSIRHEDPLPDGSRPDFAFRLEASSEGFEFVGDIRSVSDKSYHSDNPVTMFWNGVCGIARKLGLNPGHFRYNVGSRVEGEFGDQKTGLLLPARRDMQQFLKAQVEPFLRAIAASQPATAQRDFNSNGISLTLGYDASREYGGGGHAAYTTPYSRRRNPIFSALVAKGKQLRSAPKDAIRVVILCDAGCDSMRTSQLHSVGSMTATEIAQRFLAESNSLDAVLLVTTEKVKPYDIHDRELRIALTWVAGERRSKKRAQALAAFRAELHKALDELPVPILDAHNASIRSDMSGYGSGNLGDKYGMKKISLSARDVLGLLAGTYSYNDFAQNHGWGVDRTHTSNPFEVAIRDGRLIRAVTVAPGGDADDDWIEFEMGEPDPAVSPFRGPHGAAT